MREMIILRGIPGSGKSTYIQELAKQPAPTYRHTNRELWAGDTEIISADNFFMIDGVYKFDPAKLGEAHGKCLREVVGIIFAYHCVTRVIVDNTNINVAEFAPYAALALAYGWKLEIISFACSPDEGAKRNVHNVPASTIERMAKRMEEENSRIPPYWPHRYHTPMSASSVA